MTEQTITTNQTSKSQNIELIKALIKVQGELVNPSKNKQGYGYKYADLPSILDLLRPLLAKNGLAITQIPEFSNEGEIIVLKTVLHHESGETLQSTFNIPAQTGSKMSAIQAIGSGITYARRYALCGLFGIAGDDDTDGVVEQKKETNNINTKFINNNQIDFIKSKAKDKMPLLEQVLKKHKLEEVSKILKTDFPLILKELNNLKQKGENE